MSREDNRVISDDPLKYVESNRGMSQHSSDTKMKNCERLAGGADAQTKSNVNANVSDNNIDAQVTPVPSKTLRTTPGAEKEIDAIIMESDNYVQEKAVSDKKVNEMIDYVIQNLQEAEKALTSLGENFEHDLKLMFVDVMGKVQNWVGLAQIRIDTAKTDLSSLRRELVARSNEVTARDRELADLRSKLTESEVARGAYEKALTESAQRNGGPLSSPPTMTFGPSRQPMPTGVPSTYSAMDRGRPSEVQSGVQFGLQSGVQPGLQSGVQPGLQSGVQPGLQSGVQPGLQSGLQPGVHSGLQPGIQSGLQSGVQSGLQSDVQSGPQSGFQSGVQSGLQTGVQSGLQSGVQSGPQSDVQSSVQPGPQSGVQSGLQSGVQSGVPSGYPIAAEMLSDELAYDESQRAADIPSLRIVGRPDNPSTADVAIQSEKTRERAKRDSELESELSRLRKENERIMKERTDYENAIQRALLRGVSSLNAETLRVLRCPAVGCYTPCGPPPSPVNTVETMTPCASKKTRDNWTPRSCKTTANSSTRQGHSRARSNATAVPEQENNCCGNKKQSAGMYGSCLKPKKSSVTSDQSMIFLLHEADASNVCLPGNMQRIRSCGATKSKKLDTSVCVKKLG